MKQMKKNVFLLQLCSLLSVAVSIMKFRPVIGKAGRGNRYFVSVKIL